MARLGKLQPEQLSAEQRELYDQIAAGPRATGPFALTDPGGGLEGPFNAMLLSPPLGAALQALGAAVRYRSALSPRARELAILAVATHWNSAFERYAHEAIGRQAGLTEAELSALRAGELPVLNAYEDAILVTTFALLRSGDLDDQHYADAIRELGEAALFELTTLVGYYAALALQLRVFRVEPPAE